MRGGCSGSGTVVCTVLADVAAERTDDLSGSLARRWMRMLDLHKRRSGRNLQDEIPLHGSWASLLAVHRWNHR